MEKRMKRKVAAGAAALLAVAGGGAAIGATQLSPKQENQTVLNDAAKELGVTPSALAEALKNALEKRIDAAVVAGRITQAQGDEMKRRIESGELPFPGPAPGMFFHHELFRSFDAAAAYLGLSEEELHARLAQPHAHRSRVHCAHEVEPATAEVAPVPHLLVELQHGRQSAAEQVHQLVFRVFERARWSRPARAGQRLIASLGRLERRVAEFQRRQ